MILSPDSPGLFARRLYDSPGGGMWGTIEGGGRIRA